MGWQKKKVALLADEAEAMASAAVVVGQRSSDHLAFADRIADRLPERPEFSDAWLNRLVDDLAQFKD